MSGSTSSRARNGTPPIECRLGRLSSSGAAPSSPGHCGGLATGPAATGSLSSKTLRRAVLLSDGASRLPEELLRQVRAAEAVDPEGRQWPRTKRSDDATAVYLVLTDGEALAALSAGAASKDQIIIKGRCRPRGRLPAATDGHARSEGGPPRGRPLCCWLQRV
jgi:hypothetical protein